MRVIRCSAGLLASKRPKAMRMTWSLMRPGWCDAATFVTATIGPPDLRPNMSVVPDLTAQIHSTSDPVGS